MNDYQYQPYDITEQLAEITITPISDFPAQAGI